MRNSTKAMVAGGLELGTLWGAFYVNNNTPIGWWGTIPLFITAIVLLIAIGGMMVSYIELAEEDAKRLRQGLDRTK